MVFLYEVLSLLWTYTFYAIGAFVVYCLGIVALQYIVLNRRGIEIDFHRRPDATNTGFWSTKLLQNHPVLVTYLEWMSAVILLHVVGYFLFYLAYLANK